jgi:hypothetical protein
MVILRLLLYLQYPHIKWETSVNVINFASLALIIPLTMLFKRLNKDFNCLRRMSRVDKKKDQAIENGVKQ